MDNKGFTLVEVLVVVVLLGLLLGIGIPGVIRAGNRAKEKTLVAKVKSLEKAAVLYGQQSENNTKFNKICNAENEICYGKNNCYCMNETVTVDDLINSGFIEADDESGNVKNPTDTSKTLNDCTITVYKKYGKIYASYDRGTNCWVD